MNESHKEAIKVNRVFIIKELQDLKAVCDYLMARNIINDSMLQEIEVS